MRLSPIQIGVAAWMIADTEHDSLRAGAAREIVESIRLALRQAGGFDEALISSLCGDGIDAGSIAGGAS